MEHGTVARARSSRRLSGSGGAVRVCVTTRISGALVEPASGGHGGFEDVLTSRAFLTKASASSEARNQHEAQTQFCTAGSLPAFVMCFQTASATPALARAQIPRRSR
jgi:hypothetical protein